MTTSDNGGRPTSANGIPLPEFNSPEEEELFGIAQLGQEAEAFRYSPIGRFVQGCAKQEIEEIAHKILKVSPLSLFGRRKIKQLQIQAEARRLAIAWLLEAIHNGEAAYQQMNAEEHN